MDQLCNSVSLKQYALCRPCRNALYNQRPVHQKGDIVELTYIMCQNCANTNNACRGESADGPVENPALWKILTGQFLYSLQICSGCDTNTTAVVSDDNKVHINYKLCRECVHKNIKNYDLYKKM